MSQKIVNCRECGKQLTDPESIAKGIGPECAQKAEQAFGLLSVAVDAVSTGTKDTRLELRIKEHNQLERIYNAKSSRGYVAPKLIRDLNKSRNAVIARAAELKLVTLQGGQYV